MAIRRLNAGFGARTMLRWIESTFYRCAVLLGASVAASTAITGATETETAFDKNVVIPANVLEAGSIIKIRAQGIHTSTTSTETHTLAIKIGATTVYTVASVDPANNDIFVVDLHVAIRTIGASGTCVASGFALAQGAHATGTMKGVFLASTAIDTTVANTVAVYIDRQASATDGDSARLDFLSVEIC